MTTSILLCPVCKESLQANESNKSLSCENNHSFDRARQGYLNLLLAHKKNSKNPGDSQEMVIARQAFLNSDFYRPISDSLNQIIVDAALKIQALKSEKAIQVLDIGCGEGYYSQRIHHSLSDHQIEHNLFGLDISKDAVIAAAKRAKAEAALVSKSVESEWLVASAIDIPLQAHSIDIATCLFTRLMPDSYHKVIKQDGYFICVNTGEKHLIELREKLYDEITKTEFDPVKNMGEDFELIDHQQVSYQNTLSSQQQIQDLLLMTPHNWRTKADKKEALTSLEELTVTIDAQIHVFKAKEKAIVEVEVVEEVLETVSSSNPWGKSKVAAEPAALVEAVSEVAAEAAVEAPAETQTVAPQETSTEVAPQSKAASSASPWGGTKVVATEETSTKAETPAESKEKSNPWSNS
ncbi:MAG: methyltransferase domain-containing protein [Oleispira sp.]|nr:methyltransferase domain-containing protein [Oleispira sp.]MBL4880529.1 methyltransferase domain-containing protein [Oleispira sp.]